MPAPWPCSLFLVDRVPVSDAARGATVYDLEYTTLAGEPASLGAFEGRAVLIVNTASECGYTPQYAGLEALHREYGPRGLVVRGFPSNDFGGQEPGDALAIERFCSEEFGVTFPLAAKVQVKEGPAQSPVYAFLGAATGSLPGWNFGKYLIGRDGRPLAFYASNVEPGSRELRAAIEAALGS